MAASAATRCSRSRNLHVAYGKVEAVHDVSLKVERGHDRDA